MSYKYRDLFDKLEADRQLLIGVIVIGFFLFVFFACMLAFIDHAKACFTKDGTVMSKTDYDFHVAGNLIASLGLIGASIALFLCGMVVNNIRKG